MIHTIYALIDPRTEQVRYVGRTKNVEKRFRAHCTMGGNLPRKTAWIKELRRAGLRPVLRILARCRNWSRAGKREKEFIRDYAGDHLFNIKAHVHYRRRPGVRGIQRAAFP